MGASVSTIVATTPQISPRLIMIRKTKLLLKLILCSILVTYGTTSADNFCRNQGDFNATETTVPGGTDTCSALSTILLDKLSGSPSTWSAVTCENLNSVFSTSWEDTRTPGAIWNVGEVLWTYGARCCGSAYKTLLGKTCHGCIDIAKGEKANSNGWFTASGSTNTSPILAPGGSVAPSSGKFCVAVLPSTAKQGTCNVASWTNKKYGDTTAAAPYSTCDTCTVLISTTEYKTCKAYCAAQTGSLTCAGAWDDMLASCIKKKMNGKVILPTEFTSSLTCNSTIKGSDMICKCCPASGCPATTATTSGSSRSSSAGLVVGIVVGIAVAI